MDDVDTLKTRAIRSGVTKMCAQAANFLIRIGSTMVLARLLSPKDYGLLAMVTSVTSVLGLLRDFGLSSASIQRTAVTEEHSSALFWVNVLLGAVLTIVTFGLGPPIAAFYHERRLVGVADVLAIGFLINGAGAQHSALLQREMRFGAVALIDLISLTVGVVLAIGMAMAGFGYWALVVSGVSGPLISTVGSWLATKWIPGLPRKEVEIWSMMRFGGTMTLNGIIWTMATGFDKILLGRYWGPDATGIYSNASQLIRIPIDNLNTAVGDVAFSALSRIKDDPERIKRYFLKGYALVLALTLPITVGCAAFADDCIAVLLGPKWAGAAAIFRILAATILTFAILNPLGWLLNASGLVVRGLKIAIVFAPILIAGFGFGVLYGPIGVAAAYSTVMTLGIFPLMIWAVHGTTISAKDIVRTLGYPLISSVIAATVALEITTTYAIQMVPPLRLLSETMIFGACYLAFLMSAAGYRSLFLDVLNGTLTGFKNDREK